MQDSENLSPQVMLLLATLERICHEVAWDRPKQADELFELTRREAYPELIARLAESFGLMLVKIEAREYRLEEMIRELRRSKQELEVLHRRLLSENAALKQGISRRFSPDAIIGAKGSMREIMDQVQRLADTTVNILILGETGTGKELVAKALHYNSSRKSMPFVAVNCSAIPESLFESELFGIEKGVATGVNMRRGLAEKAQGGTLFLDEIADMPPAGQAKILRMLEEREVTRVGGSKAIELDVRVVAATNKDLRMEVQAGRFRGDLFFRLNVVQFRLPPLRERKEDIQRLFQHFLDTHCRNMHRDPIRADAETLAALNAYHWPGNVRELENEAERLVALATSPTVHVTDLSPHVLGREEYFPGSPFGPMVEGDESPTPPVEPKASQEVLPQELAKAESILIDRALKATHGNKTQAAALLGITREGLRSKLKRLEESTESKKP